MSLKKFIVELSDEERQICQDVVKRLKGTSQKVKRANILLKADTGWTDAKIAEALDCRVNTVENLRKRFVETGFEPTLERKKRATPGVERILDGEQEAKIVAMRLGDSPKGFGKWTLRLVARKIVELEIAPAISHQTVARTLKKTVLPPNLWVELVSYGVFGQQLTVVKAWQRRRNSRACKQ